MWMPGSLAQDRQPGTLLLMFVEIDYQNRLLPDLSCLSGGYSTAYPDLIPVQLGTGGNPPTGDASLKIKSLAYTPPPM